jgi:hypothetical protein
MWSDGAFQEGKMANLGGVGCMSTTTIMVLMATIILIIMGVSLE